MDWRGCCRSWCGDDVKILFLYIGDYAGKLPDFVLEVLCQISLRQV